MAASIDTPLPLTDLQPESDLLHLLFHRNKNQHRSGKWWKWFGMLRRNIRKLLHPSAEDGDANKRVEYMRRVLVPSCYSAFTSVVADTQFAPLGLTLLAILARVHAIVGPEKKEALVVKVKVKEVAKVVVKETSYQKRETLVELADGGEDFGEAIVRREELVEEEEEEEEIAVEEMAVVEEEDQEAVVSETPLVIRRPPVKPTARPDTVVAAVKDPKREGKTAKKKKKAVKPSVSSLPPSRVPSPPPVREERREKKSKRKSDEKEGAKKKKKGKKADEIDDLFAGLL
ncbi:hypothetical protein P167DRAFT_602707 [Morchella conica CCBAS932]|uniref:RNase MRP protein 1 RNA binding domain-containing protein n=1 Tax=Morchella conica CCBAS932 TaxID=1392247 RepID=A0A3N4L2U7_9PEZI|nr:hypothetical protein P167DRAFT_602707 [Morchella conica CCBAS932]